MRETNKSPECILVKKLFKQAQRAMKNDEINIIKRQIYIRQKKRYRKIRYKTLKVIKENKINILNQIERSEPKTFWKKIKEMTRPKDDVIKHMDPNKWSTHFKDLFQAPPAKDMDASFLEYVDKSLPFLERISTTSQDLNCEISFTEIKDTVKEIKTGKTTYIDDISNEVIKYGLDQLGTCIRHLFNVVFKSGKFPKIWNNSIIIPLYKNKGAN